MRLYSMALIATLLLAFFAGCSSGEPAPSDAGYDGGSGADSGPSLFVEGCPETGKSIAKKITNPMLRAQGPDALGVNNDFLLMNSKAAFIIQGTEHNPNTWWPYSGIVIDAVAIDNCSQASPEQFKELWLLVGNLNITDFYSSVLRGLHANSVTVLNDGSDGKSAVVRVTGEDDIFYWIEDMMIRGAFDSGKPHGHSSPYGITITVDYTLPPDSQVLLVNITFKNKTSNQVNFLSGSVAQFGNKVEPIYFAQSNIKIGTFNVDTGVPWVVGTAQEGKGSWAFGMKKSKMGTAVIEGLNALIDMNQIVTPIILTPSGTSGDSAKVSYYLSVGGGGANSAVKNLQAVNSEPVPDMEYTLAGLEGAVKDASGNAVTGALVIVDGLNEKDEWFPIDGFYTNLEGKFAGSIPKFDFVPLRLRTEPPGFAEVISETFNAGEKTVVDLTLGLPGAIAADIRDDKGENIPAKIVLWKGDQIIRTFYTKTAPETFPVPPGNYEVTVTRGIEYTTYQGSATVEAGRSFSLTQILTRAVDTSGFMSADGHMHAGPSPDNIIPIPDKINVCAAEGVEVPISTDHEYIGSWQSGIDETGLGEWIATMVGSEVTANLPEHTNIFPVVPKFDVDARGGYVKWYGNDIGQIWNLEATRGATLRQLNHARYGCAYMCEIDYDRITGKPNMTDPTLLGFPSNAALWSWDFELFELQNGIQPIFLDPKYPKSTGQFDDWQSFINLGHIVTATANTDSHNWGWVGLPVNYYESSTDKPSEFSQADLVKSMKEGRTLMSNGAFARILIDNKAGLGDLVTNMTGQVSLSVHIEGTTEIDVKYFKVFENCDLVATVSTTSPDGVVKYDGSFQVVVPKDANIVVAGFGSKPMPKGLKQYDPAIIPRFLTNPIYVDVDGDGKFTPPGGKTCDYDLLPPK